MAQRGVLQRPGNYDADHAAGQRDDGEHAAGHVVGQPPAVDKGHECPWDGNRTDQDQGRHQVRVFRRDECLLQQFDGAATWRELAGATRSCVESLERRMGVKPPSQPQIFVGAAVTDLRIPGR